MNTNTAAYNTAESDARVREILDAPTGDFQEVDSIPADGQLTYKKGYYINQCTAVFIDIRNSSQMTDAHLRPVLGKIYRAFISECVAVLNQDPNCRQIFINGDCVSGMFNANTAAAVNDALYRVAQMNSVVEILNWRLSQKGYVNIHCGIGMDHGRALMLKGGCSGTGINDVIWMGDVVNGASKLCSQGNKDGRTTIQVSTSAYNALTRPDYKAFLHPYPPVGGLGLLYPSMSPTIENYQGSFVSKDMQDWLNVQMSSAQATAAAMSSLGSLLGGIGAGLLQQRSAAEAAASTMSSLGGLSLRGIGAGLPQPPQMTLAELYRIATKK